jgi:hypothetical protein
LGSVCILIKKSFSAVVSLGTETWMGSVRRNPLLFILLSDNHLFGKVNVCIDAFRGVY